MRIKKLSLVAVMGLAMIALQAHAGGIEQMASFLSSTHSASGSFSQETVSQRGGQGVKMLSGSFMFKRPGKFVWTYEKPYKQVIISNGKRVSVWDPDLKQVTVRSMASTMPSSPAAILFGSNDFRKDFSVKNLPEEGGMEWIEAVPKARESSFESFRIGFKDAMPAAMELHDSFGQTMKLKFSGMKRNPEISASRFEFTPPKGAEILTQ